MLVVNDIVCVNMKFLGLREVNVCFSLQFQNGRVNSQLSGDYRGDDFTAAVTAANLDIVKSSGQFMFAVMSRLYYTTCKRRI